MSITIALEEATVHKPSLALFFGLVIVIFDHKINGFSGLMVDHVYISLVYRFCKYCVEKKN